VVGLPYRNPQNSGKNSSYIKICMGQNICRSGMREKRVRFCHSINFIKTFS